MIEISEWQERYEVNSRGLEAKEGDELRVGPLKYIRLKVHGHEQGTGYRRLKALAGKRTMEVFGVFCKFLEIAGNQAKCNRGKLLNEHDEPATPEDLAFILGVPIEQIVNAANILSEKSISWLICNTDNITQDKSIQLNSIQGAGDLQKSLEITGKSETFDGARRLYPGTKRGCATEFLNFKKKHKDWLAALPLLGPAIEKLIEWRAKYNGFIPDWKHFRTWINNRCWEDELPENNNGQTNNGQTTQAGPGQQSPADGGDKHDGSDTDWEQYAKDNA